MSDVCDENSVISCECSARESSSSAAGVEQSALSPNLQILGSASAPPLPISEISVEAVEDTSIDETTMIDSTGAVSPVSIVNDIGSSSASASAAVASGSAAVADEPLTDVEPLQILEEVKVIDQILEDLAPEELNQLSFDEIISLKATTPLPQVAKCASKLNTSYNEYKAYLNYIQNGSDEQNNRGQLIGVNKKKVPGVCCETIVEPPKCSIQIPCTITKRVVPSFYQFLQPQFFTPSCLPKLCAPTLAPYQQNLMRKNSCYQPLGYNYAFSNAFGRGLPSLNQTGAHPGFGQGFTSKGFTKPNFMGGFYKF